jgi:mannose-6-phosphate isomerase class I
MSSSDNVLRAGLTTTRRAGDELLRIGRFASRRPEVLRAAPDATGVSVYATSAEEFELGSVEVGGEGVVMSGERSVEVLLCYEGSVQLAPLAGGEALALERGRVAGARRRGRLSHRQAGTPVSRVGSRSRA